MTAPARARSASLAGLMAGLFAACGSAQAAVHLDIQRVDATHVLVTGSGFIDAGTPALGENHALFVYDLFAVNPAHLVNSWLLWQNDFKVGNVSINFAHDAGTGYGTPRDNVVYFGMSLPGAPNPFPALPVGAPLSGSMLWTLTDGSQFAAAGSSGLLRWGMDTTTDPFNFGLGPSVGTWNMVAAPVPEPASALLLAAGGLLLASAMRGRTVKAKSR
ncbi:PEP-CTERM sorting domain-containing protein [Pelomonas sp. Root1237]|uniref:PEP-CTERM sorting domain-containing protein n=1 Tax=Pelomonas sp. Root1237 TaxID=1736434 RepID=UPI0007140237|nr:PEP-CTERM sorting domain-containing protein [Pelomonas sp. Root1237]KQV96436.1 hypothetical protein ASC91_02490 [Pelomonas sp. Root1237]